MSSTNKKTASGRSSTSSSQKKSASGRSSSAGKTSAAAKKSTSAPKAASSSTKRKKLTVAQRRELERQQKITQLIIIVGSILVAVIVILIFMILSDKSQNKTDYTSGTSTSSSASTLPAGVYPASTDYTPAADGEQLKKPAKGEEVAVLETSMGTIKIRLFPEAVPTAVENFKTLIRNGSYNGITFHRVIDDFMIQSGITNDANGGCTFEGYSAFQDEFGRNLYNIRGAVSMANGGSNTNGSQFFIVQTKTPSYGNLGNAEGFVTYGGAQWAADAYEERGGTPYLDGQFKEIGINTSGHTVFGQVYEGMKVVDKIAAVATDSNDKPLEDVIIKKAYLETVK